MQANFFARPEFNQMTPRFGNFMNDLNYYYAPVASGNFNNPINVFDQNMLHFGHFINDPKTRFQNNRPNYFPNNWMKDFNNYNRGFDVFPQLPQTSTVNAAVVSSQNLTVAPPPTPAPTPDNRNVTKLKQNDAQQNSMLPPPIVTTSIDCKNEPTLQIDTSISSIAPINVSHSNSDTPPLITTSATSLCGLQIPNTTISMTKTNSSATPSMNNNLTISTNLTNPKSEKNANVPKPFMCNLCSASFSRHHHLRRHERSHLNTRPYRCQLCTSSFNDSWHLKRHQYTHTNEKPFKCTLCTSAFKDSWHLKRHQQIHTKIKPFQCNDCKSSFYDSWHLKRHHLQVHVKVKPYSCTSCSSKFYDSWHLKRHQQVHLRKKGIQQQQQPNSTQSNNNSTLTITTNAMTGTQNQNIPNVTNPPNHSQINTTSTAPTTHYQMSNCDTQSLINQVVNQVTGSNLSQMNGPIVTSTPIPSSTPAPINFEIQRNNFITQ